MPTILLLLICDCLVLRMVDVDAGGHCCFCMYLTFLNKDTTNAQIMWMRETIADYIAEHCDFFSQFFITSQFNLSYSDSISQLFTNILITIYCYFITPDQVQLLLVYLKFVQ